jgi:hypothetical protein
VDVLAAAVDARLGRAVFVAPADVIVDVVIAREGGAFVAQLAMIDRTGQSRGSRTLRRRGARCAALLDALSLVIALLVDLPVTDLELTLPDEPEPAPEPPPQASAQPPAPQSERIVAPAAAAVGVRGELAAHAGVALGYVPDVALALGVGGALVLQGGGVLGVWALELDVAAIVSSAPIEPPDARFTAILGALVLCPALLRSELGISVCAGVGAGTMLAEPVALDYGALEVRPLADLRATVRGEWDLAPARLRLEVGAAAPFVRDAFVISLPDGAVRRLFQPSEVVLLARLSVAFEPSR